MKSNDIIGNRTRDLLPCSAVPQPSAPPGAPYLIGGYIKEQEASSLAVRGGVRSTRGLGPTMTARGQSIGISIGTLPQTLIMSRLDQLSRLGARI